MKQISKYYTSQTLYNRGKNPKKVKDLIEQYLQERVNGIPVGIDAKLIFILAKVNLKLKDEQEAEKLFLECIKLDPNNVHARFELGRLYLKQGKEEAEKLFLECLKIDLRDIPARIELVIFYKLRGMIEKSKQMLMECIEIDPDNEYAIGQLRKIQKDEETEKSIDDAGGHKVSVMEKSTLTSIEEICKIESLSEKIRICQEILDKDPNNKEVEMLLYALLDEQIDEMESKREESLYYKAKTLYKSKKSPKEVKNLIEKYLKEKEEGKPVGIDCKMIFILAKVNLRLKYNKEAEKLFKICIKLDKNNLCARLELGKLYVKQGKEEEAEKLFTECIKLDLNNLYAMLELGKLYVKQGKEKEAERLFLERLKIDLKDTYAKLELGRLYVKQGKEKEAEKLFLECIKLNQNNLHARLELGRLYVKQGKKKEAEKLFQEYMALDPKNVHARLELGKLYVKQGKEKEAEELFIDCMSLDLNDLHARLELGRLYVKQGKEEEAEKLFQEYMALDPNNVHARLELGRLYVKQGKEKEAEKLFQEYMALDPNNVHARLELGKLYVKQGKDQEAEKLFQEYMKLDPNNLYARIELGTLYARQGKDKKAEKLFLECLEIKPGNISAIIKLAIFYKIRGKKEKSKQMLMKCLEIDPNNEFAIDQLRKIQKDEETENCIDDATEHKASVMEESTLTSIEEIYKAESLTKKIKICQAILEKDPDNVEVQMILQSLQEEARQEEKTKVEKESESYVLRKDGLVDGLSCIVAKYFSEIPAEEIEESKRRFMYYRQKQPEEVTMETDKLVWYLRFRYKNYSILERFFRIKDNGEYEAMNSATLIIPNDVKIENGNIDKSQIPYIERQVHRGDYFELLEQKIQKVEQGYLQRNQELEY